MAVRSSTSTSRWPRRRGSPGTSAASPRISRPRVPSSTSTTAPSAGRASVRMGSWPAESCSFAADGQYWAVVHTIAARVIQAPPERVMDLYLDYASWPRLFPRTIRGVQLLGEEGGRVRLEVDHVFEGKVLNVMTVIS